MKNVLVAVGMVGIVLVGRPTQGADTKDLRLQEMLDELVDSGVPGISVAIANKNGILWQGVAGQADLVNGIPVRKDHLFGIGSITKTFVSVIVLQLAAEGRVDLNMSVGELLGSKISDLVPSSRGASIAQLLNHTSGIPSWEDDPIWIKEGRGANLKFGHIWGKAETLPYISSTPRLHEPGTRFAYANTNHTLLGLVIEKVTGSDLTVEIRNRILSPLGLTDIYLEGFQPIPEDRLASRYHHATGHFIDVAGLHNSFGEARLATDTLPQLIDVTLTNLSVEWAAGGMVATASDLALYSAAYRSGKLLNAESMAFVKTWVPIYDWLEVGPGLFRRKSVEGDYLVGHLGSVLGYTAAMHWLEDEDISIAVLSNVGTMHIGQSLPNAWTLGIDPLFVAEAKKLISQHQ